MKYFRYERDHARRWTPALYVEKPTKSDKDASEWINVKPHQDGYPSLELLVKRHPAPKE